MPKGPVTFYFDFLSPYSYLASRLVAGRAFDLLYRPVVLGTILSRRGVKGPGEIPTRRRRNLEDVLILADHYGIPIEGPPTHPFNSIYALRSVCAVDEEATRACLTAAYFRAAWEKGESLEDLDVLARCLREVGVDQDPEEAATDRTVRAALKHNTRTLLDLGGWGVPTFVTGELLFFGHDRIDLLESVLRGDAALPKEKLEEMLARPQPGRIV